MAADPAEKSGPDSTQGGLDSDGDGLINRLEARRGTKPDIKDTDDDGVEDLEDAVGYDPLLSHTFTPGPDMAGYAVLDLGPGQRIRSLSESGEYVLVELADESYEVRKIFGGAASVRAITVPDGEVLLPDTLANDGSVLSVEGNTSPSYPYEISLSSATRNQTVEDQGDDGRNVTDSSSESFTLTTHAFDGGSEPQTIEAPGFGSIPESLWENGYGYGEVVYQSAVKSFAYRKPNGQIIFRESESSDACGTPSDYVGEYSVNPDGAVLSRSVHYDYDYFHYEIEFDTRTNLLTPIYESSMHRLEKTRTIARGEKGSAATLLDEGEYAGTDADFHWYDYGDNTYRINGSTVWTDSGSGGQRISYVVDGGYGLDEPPHETPDNATRLQRLNSKETQPDAVGTLELDDGTERLALWIPQDGGGQYQEVPLFAKGDDYPDNPIEPSDIRGFNSDRWVLYGSSKLWANGYSIDADDWADDLQPDLWSDFDITDLRDHGFLYGTARKEGTDNRHAVLLLKMELTHFVHDLNSGEVYPSGGTVPESDPIPNLGLDIISAEVNANGALVIEMEGRFRDPLSELLPSGQRLTTLDIRLNDELLETIDDLDALSSGDFNPDIQNYSSRVSFSRTFTIPQAHFGSHILSIEAGPNAAGTLGRAAVGIAVNEIPAGTQPTAQSFPVSVQFLSYPDDETTDSITFYSGDRDPLPGDPVAVETAAGSRTFTGTLLIDQTPRSATFWMWDAEIEAFDPSSADSFIGGFRYLGDNDEEFIFLGKWTESSPGSLRFFPTEFFNEYEAVVPVVAGIFPLEGTREGHVLPYTVRIDDSLRRDYLFHPEDGSMTVALNDTALPLTSYSRSDNPEMADSDYYLADGSKPGIFLNMRQSPLPMPAGGSDGAKEYSLHARSTDAELTRYYAYPEISPEEAPPIMAAPMSTTGDEDGEWEEQTWYFFDLLYGDLGEKYLQAFNENNGNIEFENLGWLNFSGYKYRHAWMEWKGDPEIEIERDQTPPEAAMKLFTALNHFIVRHTRIKLRYIELIDGDPEAFQQLQLESLAFGAQKATLLAEIYLSGYSLIAEPIDWIFIARDVEQGQYLSLAAALPFVSIQAVRYGKAVTIQLPSGATSRIQGAPLSALAEAAQANTRLHRMEILSPHIVSGGLDSETVGLLYRSGFLQAKSTPARLLAQDMIRVGKGNRPWRHQAHHDLPTEFEEFFIRAGIDPNHGNFGRWIPKSAHARWHNAKGFDSGGPFNHMWRIFLAPGRSRAEILERLDLIQSGHIFTIVPSHGGAPLNISFH